MARGAFWRAVVRDLSGLIIYVENIDYTVTSAWGGWAISEAGLGADGSTEGNEGLTNGGTSGGAGLGLASSRFARGAFGPFL